MNVVSDASPLIALDAIGLLELLPRLYGQITVPSRVYEEAATENVRTASWLTIVDVENVTMVESLLAQGLDRGEVESIVLAWTIDAETLIIDERKGRIAAEQLGLPRIGTLGLLVMAKQKQMVGRIQPLMDALMQNISFRIGPALYREVLKDCGEAD